jgi:hypothetical protein
MAIAGSSVILRRRRSGSDLLSRPDEIACPAYVPTDEDAKPEASKARAKASAVP